MIKVLQDQLRSVGSHPDMFCYRPCSVIGGLGRKIDTIIKESGGVGRKMTQCTLYTPAVKYGTFSAYLKIVYLQISGGWVGEFIINKMLIGNNTTLGYYFFLLGLMNN